MAKPSRIRCDSQEYRSGIHTGFSRDGIHWEIEQKAIQFQPVNGEVPRSGTSYDPRITELEGRYYITWCNDNHGSTIGLAVTAEGDALDEAVF